MKHKKKIIFGALGLIAILAIWLAFFNKETEELLTVKAKKGYFKVSVATTGELKAKNSIEIRGPSGAERLGIYQMKISKIVPEGTVVKSGDFVCELDRTEIMTKLKEMQLQIQKYESQYTQSKLDSTLNLSQARDDMENMKATMEEKKLAVDQSIYEAPAAQRQAQLAYERENRSFKNSIKNYATKVQQAIAKLNEVGADLNMEKENLNKIMQTFDQFTIMAPADGMVIYIRNWNGQRNTVGSVINSWYPIVASLPDLSAMESVTYVNEIDIQKIKNDQKVTIKLDANPNKKIKGKVVKVANIGEERKNSDSKVFEVLIQVLGKDTTLLPSMTTSNEIVVEEYKDVVYVPIESIHTEEKNGKLQSFVYKMNGVKPVKTKVELGAMNENEVIIKKGIKQNDEVLLSLTPEMIAAANSKDKKK